MNCPTCERPIAYWNRSLGSYCQTCAETGEGDPEEVIPRAMNCPGCTRIGEEGELVDLGFQRCSLCGGTMEVRV